MSDELIRREIYLQKEISELENILTQNLCNLAKALKDASDGRFMSVEHAKIVWKSYLTVSGMDIPKNMKKEVLKIIEAKRASVKE